MSIELKELPLRYTARDGTLTESKVQVQVEADGTFRAEIPREVAAALNAMVDDGRVPGVSTDTLIGEYHAVAKTLDVLEWGIEKAAKETVTDETVERVIVYSPNTALSAWQTPDGELHPNGYAGGVDRGGWHHMGKGVNATHRVNHFTVGLYARVFDMKTIHGASGKHVTLTEPEWGHGRFEFPTYAAKLNGFSSLKLPSYLSDLQHLPYTEEAAKYFYEAMLRLCALGTHVHALFNDPATLERAIADGTHVFDDRQPKEPS